MAAAGAEPWQLRAHASQLRAALQFDQRRMDPLEAAAYARFRVVAAIFRELLRALVLRANHVMHLHDVRVADARAGDSRLLTVVLPRDAIITRAPDEEPAHGLVVTPSTSFALRGRASAGALRTERTAGSCSRMACSTSRSAGSIRRRQRLDPGGVVRAAAVRRRHAERVERRVDAGRPAGGPPLARPEAIAVPGLERADARAARKLVERLAVAPVQRLGERGAHVQKECGRPRERGRHVLDLCVCRDR